MLRHVLSPKGTTNVTMLDPTMPATESTDETVNGFAELGLPRPLVTGLARQGINAPFPIQEACIPDILSGHDVLGRGQTGSGKTLAFGLPMMTRISGDRALPRRPKAIILVPTRELALQVNDALEPLGRGLGLKMKTVVGGMSMGRQIEALRRGVEVIVATPGRLTDLIEQGECSLEDVEVSILDEADHMCDLGFFPVVSALLDQTPSNGQRLLFSATLDGDVDQLVRRFLVNPITHSLAPATSSVETMEHHLVTVSWQDKPAVTAEIANREGRTILFVRTQHGVDRVVKQLARVGVKAGGLHGGKRQNQRTRILGEFREGGIMVLVCTDVAARGIHVDDVSLVLHVDPPADHKSYLHRGGRTARAGEKGSVLTLVMPNERRATDSMARRAGIAPSRHRVVPGAPVLADIAGAREPSGESIPVWEPDIRKPLRTRNGGSGGRDERPSGGRGRRFEGRRRNDGDRPFAQDDRPRYNSGDSTDRPRREGDDRPRYNGGNNTDRPRREGDERPPRREFGHAPRFQGGDAPRHRDERPRYQGDDRPRRDAAAAPAAPAARGHFRDDRAPRAERPVRDDRAEPRAFSEDRPRGTAGNRGRTGGGFRGGRPATGGGGRFTGR
ncbi:DEAD/DEAH box helicase [Herbidospora mongoliensis]|uniref:DEAD/DEAH box helicase n=1 Tax=Herbidospora mongoliensis TaxID=688067 RepID=UPI000A818401|nr:DEAD/DEAH box helicase [Herbidospora mongoliensis]